MNTLKGKLRNQLIVQSIILESPRRAAIECVAKRCDWEVGYRRRNHEREDHQQNSHFVPSMASEHSE